MVHNKLKLNDDKTEIMFISSRFYQKHVTLTDFTTDDVKIEPASSARNIGVMFDTKMTMGEQVTTICKSAHYHLRNIGRIRKARSFEACKKLIHAFVTSRLDCGNATLYGLPNYQNYRLQRMFNIAARILTLTPPS
jgi:hypothetical protein